ncbi:MAG: hypothetical protein U0802_02835 [Candidatus Binatia bacterium]
MRTVSPDSRPRARTHAEAAFVLLRVLIRGQVLFAGESGLSLAAAGALVDAPPQVLRAAIERLLADGVIEYDVNRGGVRLSRDTLAELSPAALLH